MLCSCKLHAFGVGVSGPLTRGVRPSPTGLVWIQFFPDERGAAFLRGFSLEGRQLVCRGVGFPSQERETALRR